MLNVTLHNTNEKNTQIKKKVNFLADVSSQNYHLSPLTSSYLSKARFNLFKPVSWKQTANLQVFCLKKLRKFSLCTFFYGKGKKKKTL